MKFLNVPENGILPVTVPGAVWGWEAVLKRFGTLTFKEVLEPAVEYAQNGFPISERIAHDWRLPNALPLKACCTKPDPDSVRTWYVQGRPPQVGQIFKNPDLARAFHLLQAQGAAWRLTGGRYRQPYFVHPTNSSVFGVAAVWDRSESDGDDVIESCSIIRVPVNALLADIAGVQGHMLAILRRRDYQTWLRGTPVEARAVLRAYSAKLAAAS